MVRIDCKHCKYDKMQFETRLSTDSNDVAHYCDPRGILKHRLIASHLEDRHLITIDQNQSRPCECFEPKWYVRLMAHLTGGLQPS